MPLTDEEEEEEGDWCTTYGEVRYEEESAAQRVNHGLPHQASRAPLTMTYRLHYVTLIIREKCESQESRGIRHDAI